MSPQERDQGHRRLVGITTTLAIIVGAFVLFEPETGSEEVTALPPELADEPDLYMEDATITQYQKDGSLQYQLFSTEIRHFEAAQLTRLVAPSLEMHSPGKPPWSVSAGHGYIRKRALPSGGDEEVVFLRENVLLEQRYEDGQRLKVRSSSMYIYPDRQYAETDQDVMIDTNVGRTQAIGMQGDLQRGLFNLSSTSDQRVHTIVLPKQFK